MTARVTSRVLLILHEIEEKSKLMTSQELGALRSLVNTSAVITHDIELRAWTCICQ